jgi:hypothetical protein
MQEPVAAVMMRDAPAQSGRASAILIDRRGRKYTAISIRAFSI